MEITMPLLKNTSQITNQELLKELEKRIEQGTIKIEFDSQVDGSEPTPSLGLSKNTLLIGVLAIALLFFYSQSKSSTSVLTTVKIKESK